MHISHFIFSFSYISYLVSTADTTFRCGSHGSHFVMEYRLGCGTIAALAFFISPCAYHHMVLDRQGYDMSHNIEFHLSMEFVVFRVSLESGYGCTVRCNLWRFYIKMLIFLIIEKMFPVNQLYIFMVLFSHGLTFLDIWHELASFMQEWPISVTYGAAAGYLCGLVASSICILILSRFDRAKTD